MLGIIFLLGCALALYLLSQGAPYVPTRRKDALAALNLMGLPKSSLIADVGAGDGAVMKIAVEQGYRAIGIELNPAVWLVAKLRLRRYGDKTRLVFGNMWRWQLPEGTKGVFLFTAGPFASRMAKWLRQEQKRLGRPLKVVSLGFELSGETEVKREGGCILYDLR